jgi:hypothetical protein
MSWIGSLISAKQARRLRKTQLVRGVQYLFYPMVPEPGRLGWGSISGTKLTQIQSSMILNER